MDALEIFQRYRAERRRQTYAGWRLEVLPHLSRHTAHTAARGGLVMFADLPPEDGWKAIDAEIAHFARLGQMFEWKVYDFDSPPSLRKMLEERGFRTGDDEAFLMLETAEWRASARAPDGVTLEKIADPDRLRDFVAAESEIWPGGPGNLAKYADELAADPTALSIYCAYAGDRPVGTGRVSFPAGSAFADINGGGVVPDLRGRGIFTALLAQRIEEAKTRGYRWVAVDAGPMSRPILLQKGFRHVCWTYPMTRPAAENTNKPAVA